MSSTTHSQALLSSTTILILVHQISESIHHNQEVALRACWLEMASASSGPLSMGPRPRSHAIPRSSRQGSYVRKTSTSAEIQKTCDILKSSKNLFSLSQFIELIMNKDICIVKKFSSSSNERSYWTENMKISWNCGVKRERIKVQL